MPGLDPGAEKLSKLRLLRSTVPGVLSVRGVLGHARWPGLGVMLTKSAKSNPCEGVCGPLKADSRPPPPPGVVIMEDGRARSLFLGGGVDGGCIRVLADRFVGEGDVARNSSKSAPSSPDLPFLSLMRRLKLPLLRTEGGVRGADDGMLKE